MVVVVEVEVEVEVVVVVVSWNELYSYVRYTWPGRSSFY